MIARNELIPVPCCPVCGFGSHALLFVGKDSEYDNPGEFPVVQCLRCGLAYLSVVPGRRRMGTYYPQSYRAYGTKRDWMYALYWKFMARLVLHSDEAYFGLPINPNSTGRNGLALDLGVGDGVASRKLRRARWSPIGIDRSRQSALFATSAGIPTVLADAAKLPFDDGTFSLVLASHVVEHVSNPMEVLKEAHRVLQSGGMLVLAVPNFDSIDARLFGRNWYLLSAPRHMTHFSPHSLEFAIERSGFTLEKVVTTPGVTLASSALKKLGVPYQRIVASKVLRAIQLLAFPLDFLTYLLGRGSNLLAIAKKT